MIDSNNVDCAAERCFVGGGCKVGDSLDEIHGGSQLEKEGERGRRLGNWALFCVNDERFLLVFNFFFPSFFSGFFRVSTGFSVFIQW